MALSRWLLGRFSIVIILFVPALSRPPAAARGREFSLIGTSGVFDRGMAKDGFIIVNLRRVEHAVRLVSARG